MRNGWFVAVSVLAVVTPCGAQIVTQMTPTLIQEAIKKGGVGCYPLYAFRPLGGQSIDAIGCFSTPYSRVAGAAQLARQKYMPFSEANVTAEMLAPELRIHAFPYTDGPGVTNAEAVVIKPKKSSDPSAVVRPTQVTESLGEYKNKMGAVFQSRKSIVATFPLDALSADKEIRLIYEDSVCYEGGGFLGLSSGKMTPTPDCITRFVDFKKIR